MAKGGRYEVLEHTADAGVVAHGRTLGETFAAAAEGMYALMVNPRTVGESVEREVALSAPDRERLLVAWLLELLFLTQTEGLVFRRFDVTLDGESALRARVWGEPLDPNRHEAGTEVKAVTRHQLEVAEEDGGYRARVIFDI